LLNNGRLGTRAKVGEAETESPGGAAPDGYVPGGWLSLAIGKLEAKPMILRTESFLGDQGTPITQPMRLIVTPGGTSKLTDGGKTPLRCVSIEVSGTGEVSRYYFRPDGALDSIDYPDYLLQTRSDLATVRFQSGGDQRMSP
jgi:hypothetical protein